MDRLLLHLYLKSTDRSIENGHYLSVLSTLVQHRCRAVRHSDVWVNVIVELLLLEVLPAVR